MTSTTRHHPSDVITALEARGLSAYQPHHLDTVWVNLADGSTLHIGNDDDNLSLLADAGYSVYRDLDAEGVGGPNGDGWILASPDASFDDLIAVVVAEARATEQDMTTTIAARIDGEYDYMRGLQAWLTEAEKAGVTVTFSTCSWADGDWTEHDVPEFHPAAILNEDDICGVIASSRQFYFIIHEHGTIRAVLVPLVRECGVCHGEQELGPKDQQATCYHEARPEGVDVCSDACGKEFYRSIAEGA